MAVDGSHPLIYRHFAQGRISIETMVLLDKLVGFSKLWEKYDDIVLNENIIERAADISKYFDEALLPLFFFELLQK